MLKRQKNLIQNVLIFFLAINIISGCNLTTRSPNFISAPEQPRIIPSTDILNLNPINWIVVTPENSNEVFSQSEDNKNLFALNRQNFENLMLNYNDILSLLRQQQIIIETQNDSE